MDAVRLGAVCRALRIKKGWRQIDLALRAGCARSVISDIENGRIGKLQVDTLIGVIGGIERSGERIIAPEVSFAIRGERGVIDILAWHAKPGHSLVIELKTDIVDE